MKRILIDGRQADISGAPIAINWEYLNLSDPGKKYSPYTSSLTLPFTPKNKSLMGFGDVVGADLSSVRNVQDVDLWLGPLRFIRGGTLKVLSSTKDGYQGTITGRNRYIEAIEDYTLDEIIADCAATFTYADYADAIESLRAGSDAGINPGFILPRTLEGSIASSIWTIYSVANGHTHEVWLSASAIITQMIAEGVLTLKVWEGDALIDVTASTLWADLEKLYMPCWNWVLYDGATWTLELASGQRLINGEVVDRSQLVTFGGRTSWDFIKAIAQLFCAAVYQDRTEITLVPLANISSAGAVNLSGKVRKEKKYFAIPGQGSVNYIGYNNTDNLPKEYGRMTVTAPVKPAVEKELLTLDLMLPGQLWVNQYSKNFFNTDFNGNGALATAPMLLYDSGDPDYTTITHGTDTETDILLKVLTHFNFSGYWAPFQMMSSIGECYDAEVFIDHYTLSKLRPWLLVRINELGGLFYLNKISGFDPDTGKPAKCQVVRWGEGGCSVSTNALKFTYTGQTQQIVITSTVAWTATVSGTPIGGVLIDKTSGSGDDVITVTMDGEVFANNLITITFGTKVELVTCRMDEMLLVSVDTIGTQTYLEAFSPAPSIEVQSIDGGNRRVFWAIYNGASRVRSGYKDLTLPPMVTTEFIDITGLTVLELPDTDFTFKVGYEAGTYGVSSANYEVIL